MNQKIFKFSVEGKELESPKEKITAKEILEIAETAGIFKGGAYGGGDPGMFVLKSGNNRYSGDDWVDLLEEKDFSLAPPPGKYPFEVNGQPLESESEKLVASDILNMAYKKGYIPSKPDRYILQLAGSDTKFQGNDWVDLAQFNKFLAILNAPTPVAQ